MPLTVSFDYNTWELQKPAIYAEFLLPPRLFILWVKSV